MIQFFKSNKKEILISLVTGIILIYVGPPLYNLGVWFVDRLVDLSISFSNYYYSTLAENNTLSFDETNNTILLWLMLCTVIYILQDYVQSKVKLLQEAKALKRKNSLHRDQLLGKLQYPQTDEEKQKMLDEMQEVDDSLDGILSALEKKKKSVKVMVMCYGLFVLYFYTKSLFHSIISDQINDFKIELTKLAPNVPEKTVKLLQAQWVEMDSKVDYDSIQQKISVLKGMVAKQKADQKFDEPIQDK